MEHWLFPFSSSNNFFALLSLHFEGVMYVFVYGQVVVMRVAIHCEGCAGKVKKHLSKMEGTSLHIYILIIWNDSKKNNVVFWTYIQCNVRSYIIQCRRRVEEGDSDGIRFSGESSSEHFHGQEGWVLELLKTTSLNFSLLSSLQLFMFVLRFMLVSR